MYIYIGTAASPNKLEYCKKKSKLDSSFVQQKWDFSLCKEFSLIKKNSFKAISFQAIPVFPIGKPIYLKRNSEIIESLCIDYIGCSNLPLFKQITSSNNLYKSLKSICKQNDDIVIITHCLYPQSFKAIKRLKKKFNNVIVVSLIPDLPEFSYPIWGKKHKFLFRLWTFFNKSKFTIKSIPNAYICFVKTQMDFLDNKPFIELNGIADVDFIDKVPSNGTPMDQMNKKILLYAGSINSDSGVKELIDGFIRFNNSNYELHLYGNGNYVENLKQNKFEGVFYKGQVGYQEIINLEKNAFMLINPRPTKENYSRYSFPSKLLEYMCTKTPILTTSLLPLNDTFQDLMLFAGNGTANDFYDAFVRIDKLDYEHLKKMANNAFSFVSKNMKSDVQVLKIIDFCEEIKRHGTNNI